MARCTDMLGSISSV